MEYGSKVVCQIVVSTAVEHFVVHGSGLKCTEAAQSELEELSEGESKVYLR